MNLQEAKQLLKDNGYILEEGFFDRFKKKSETNKKSSVYVTTDIDKVPFLSKKYIISIKKNIEKYVAELFSDIDTELLDKYYKKINSGKGQPALIKNKNNNKIMLSCILITDSIEYMKEMNWDNKFYFDSETQIYYPYEDDDDVRNYDWLWKKWIDEYKQKVIEIHNEESKYILN